MSGSRRGVESTKKENRCLSTLAVACLFIGGCSIAVNNSGPSAEYSETLRYSKSNTSFKEISVNNISGTVDIAGVDSLNCVQVKAVKEIKDGSTAEARDHIGDISIEMDSTASGLSIITHQPKSVGRRSYEVDYGIRVPSSWSVLITIVNGAATVTNISNDVNVSTVNGTVNTTGIVGDLRARVQNGDINAGLVLPAGGTCGLNTTNGKIVLTVPRSTSATIKASVVSGTVSASNLAIVKTSSSRTHIIGVIGKGQGSISLNAVNGTIELRGN